MAKKKEEGHEADAAHDQAHGTESHAGPHPMAAQAQAVGLNFDDVRSGLKRLLPIMKSVATLTPTKVDDAAVAFIESLLAQ